MGKEEHDEAKTKTWGGTIIEAVRGRHERKPGDGRGNNTEGDERKDIKRIKRGFCG